MREGMEPEVPAALISFEESELRMLEKSLFHENEVMQDCERPSDECLSEKVIEFLQSDFAHEAVSDVQACQNLVSQVGSDPPIISTVNELEIANFGNDMSSFSRSLCHPGLEDAENASRKQCELNCSQVLRESMHIVACDNHHESSDATSNGYDEKKISSDFEEVSQPQHGTRKRCLQFESAEFSGNASDTSRSSWTTEATVPSSTSLVNATPLEILEPSRLESRVTPKNRQPANHSRPKTFRLSLVPVNRPETPLDKAKRLVTNSGNSIMATPVSSGIGLHLNSIVNVAKRDCGAAASIQLADRPIARRERSPSVIERQSPNDSESCPLTISLSGKIISDNNLYQQKNHSIMMASSRTIQSSGMKSLNDVLQLKLIEHRLSPCHKRKYASENAESSEDPNQPSSKRKRKEPLHNTESEGCKSCSCKKSKCLKLYCECFAGGLYCDDSCACQDCFNKLGRKDIVLETRKQIESRNPLAFTPKLVRRVTKSPLSSEEEDKQATSSLVRHKRGCSCKKSECLKRYCECYQAGVGCTDGCRCQGCKNKFGVKEGCVEVAEAEYNRSGKERWDDPFDVKPDVVDDRSSLLTPAQSRPHSVPPSTPSFQSSNHRTEMPKSQLPGSSYIRSPSNSNGHQEETSERILNIVTCNNDVECTKAGTVDQYYGDTERNTDALPHTPLRITTSSVLSHKSCSNSQLVSPITPFRRLGQGKFTYKPSSPVVVDKDTPEILKDHPSSIKVIKKSSPNHKRISPPHIQDQQSSSSMGLRSGRKFILRSISSLPPQPP